MSKTSLERNLVPFIQSDLKEKIVFLSGPRQVGKTTLALKMLEGDESHPAYFNWDDETDQKKLLSKEFPPNRKLLVFDEIHKFKRWRNWLKGIYDKTKSKHQYLITGSARLDLYRRGGDALGRAGLFQRAQHPAPLLRGPAQGRIQPARGRYRANLARIKRAPRLRRP